MLLGELLVESKVITAEQLGEVLSSPREGGKKLGQILLDRGWITEAQLTQTLSLQLSVPWVSLYHIDFSRQLLNRLSREICEKYCLIPIFIRHVKGQGETMYVAMDDPTNQAALSEVMRLAGLPTRPMIASASDIRSAIRVYYGEGGAPMIDVPPPPTRIEAPMTTREGRAQRVEPTPAAPHVAVPPPPPANAAPPDVRRSSAPPPPPSRASRPPSAPPATTATLANDDSPPTTRSNPPVGDNSAIAALAAVAAAAASSGRSRRAGEEETARRRPRALALTLLDGTTIKLPTQKKAEGPANELTARDFVSALRASAHGADVTEVLGEQVRWEPVVAALLSILLRKGLIADWEFVEELRKS